MDLGILFGKLIGQIKKAAFVKEVELRVYALQNGPENERRTTQRCECVPCVAAKMYVTHLKIAGDVRSFDPECPCHNCVSEADGEPDRAA